jgi:threonyl-tRNA synthetase
MQVYPQAKRTIGPSIDTGFYYDFDFGQDKISETNLPKIEKVMRKLALTWKGFVKNELSVEAVKDEFKDNEYKIELIDEHSGAGEVLTVYQSGEFRDLCRGGHVEERNKVLKYYKLLSVAGAYWRGDEKNKMLTRIYGTAFFTQEELDQYLYVQAEAKKRDHRKLGRELDLFSFSDMVGSGMPLYSPKEPWYAASSTTLLKNSRASKTTLRFTPPKSPKPSCLKPAATTTNTRMICSWSIPITRTRNFS